MLVSCLGFLNGLSGLLLCSHMVVTAVLLRGLPLARPSVPPALESRARRWAGKAAPLPGCYQRPCARNILIGTLVDIREAMASIQAIGHGLPKFQLPPVEHKKAIVTFGDRLQLN